MELIMQEKIFRLLNEMYQLRFEQPFFTDDLVKTIVNFELLNSLFNYQHQCQIVFPEGVSRDQVINITKTLKNHNFLNVSTDFSDSFKINLMWATNEEAESLEKNFNKMKRSN